MIFEKRKRAIREVNGSQKTREYFQWAERKKTNLEFNIQKNIFQR